MRDIKGEVSGPAPPADPSEMKIKLLADEESDSGESSPAGPCPREGMANTAQLTLRCTRLRPARLAETSFLASRVPLRPGVLAPITTQVPEPTKMSKRGWAREVTPQSLQGILSGH